MLSLKIGVLKEVDFMPVTRSVKRAVEEAAKALEEKGYEIVKFDISSEEI